jgi:hypothetical protein
VPHTRAHPLRRGPPAGRTSRIRRADQVEEVGALDLIELQRAGDAIQHLV